MIDKERMNRSEESPIPKVIKIIYDAKKKVNSAFSFKEIQVIKYHDD